MATKVSARGSLSKGRGTPGTLEKGRQRARTPKVISADQEAFLERLGECASVLHACIASKLPRRTVYNWRNSCSSFKAAWDKALELGTDALEDEAVRRAYHGNTKPVFQGGKQVGSVTEYSDTLLIFLLKARRPDRFRERTEVEHIGEARTKFIYVPPKATGRKAKPADR